MAVAATPPRGVTRRTAAVARTRGVAAGRSAQRACERSSDWRRGAAGSPDPDAFPCSPDPDPALFLVTERKHDAEAHTWKQQTGSLGPRSRLHEHDRWLQCVAGQAGDDRADPVGG